ncbi:hypothetical protein P171DRAFT_485776 [Karstenula rhodostoma CBS 690.94]|uniref:BTB domain-containing protein n=1 Tax=Karstenula rhodostoma CBS 690.94 TaxID=1392251 RepID=A0A9P4UBN3_9PLEO|nr:hypothetical protein P171DRAFT_485776 [Karstenula rhodostoma CBS 690.94]
MADLTFTFGSSYGPGPGMGLRKRPRTAYEEAAAAMKAPSKIQDRRVAVSALRLDCDLITIKVGKDTPQRTFKIHIDVLNDHTSYFRSHLNFDRAISGSDAPPEPPTISLSDHDPDAFALWRTWIYTGKLAILPDPPLAPDSSLDERTAHYAVLAHAYILGDYLVDVPFMNAVADVYVLNARGIDGSRALYPSNEEIGVLYDGTSPDSPIRKLLVDIWMYRGKVEWLETEAEDGVLPREFLVEVVRELLRLKKVREGETMSRPWKMTHEQYHDRREGRAATSDAAGHRCEGGDEVCGACLMDAE